MHDLGLFPCPFDLNHAGSARGRTDFSPAYEVLIEVLNWILAEALHLADLKERGDLKHHQVSLGKLLAVDNALAVARLGKEIMGARGLTDECAVGRHLLNLEVFENYAGTKNILTIVIGQELTGLSAFES